MVHAAGWPFPVFGPAGDIAAVNLFDLGGVFDNKIGGPYKVVECVIAWPVAARAPFDGITCVSCGRRRA